MRIDILYQLNIYKKPKLVRWLKESHDPLDYITFALNIVKFVITIFLVPFRILEFKRENPTEIKS